MLRIILLFGLFILSIGLMYGCDNDVIVDLDDNQNAPFPNTIGTWWRYSFIDSVDGVTNDTVTVTVAGHKELPSGALAKVWLIESDEGVDSMFVEEAGDTVRLYRKHFSDPAAFIFPLLVGDEWSSGLYVRDTSWVTDSSLWTFLPGLTTPAFRVERHWATPGYIEVDEFWIMPGVGIVFMNLQAISAIVDEPGLDQRWLLLEYSIEN